LPTQTTTLAAADIARVVTHHVQNVQAVDVHTHLLPPAHGSLLLYGVDQLLTYHYLVAELFMVLPLESEGDSVSATGSSPPSPDVFFSWPKSRQAELVFEELFVKRTPLSEACRGVITTLNVLGLGELLREATRLPGGGGGRLAKLRAWFAAREPAAYVEEIFKAAGLRYAVMTNVPFSPEEAAQWLAPGRAPLPACLRPALRVDPLLGGNWPAARASNHCGLPLRACSATLLSYPFFSSHRAYPPSQASRPPDATRRLAAVRRIA
jgi:hypothetical protein